MGVSIATGVTAGGGGSGTSKWTTGTSYTGLLATRCKSPTNGGAGAGAANHMARTIHFARDTITQLQVGFANWYVGAAGELPGGGIASCTAAIEYPLGTTCTQIKFSGLATGTMQDYATLISDVLQINIPNGAAFAVREWRNYPSGGSVTFTGVAGIDTLGGDCFSYGAAGSQTDITMTPGTFAGGDGNSYSAPVFIIGPTTMPCYALVGDSRGEGYGDAGNGNYDIGMIARAVGPKRAYVNLCKYGETAGTAATTGFLQRQAIAQKYTTHVIVEYAVNDIYNGTSLAQTQAYLNTIWNYFNTTKFVYQTTIMGETNSTDGWATLGNQTLTNAGDNTVRNQLNNFLRSGTAHVDGVFDATLAFETASNSGFWKSPGYTIDGVHGSATANAATVPYYTIV